MKSALLGEDISGAEVGNVSRHGFWLLVSGRELFLSFKDFPWFADAPIAHLVNVQLLHPHHLYWPDLDVDLSLESIENPERFPLISRLQPGKPLPRRTGVRPRRSGARSARQTRRR